MPKKARKRRMSRAEMYMQEQTLFSKERTILSKERTVLSFAQTGLAFVGVGIVIINVFSRSPESVIVGTALILLGFIEIVDSYRRLKKYQDKMNSIKKELGKDGV